MMSLDKLTMTRQRQVIIEELRGVDTHPTADEVYEMVRKRLPHISLATVYRNLDTLSENGVVRKLQVAGTQMRFDGNMGSHHHVRCKHCGRVDDISSPVPELGSIAPSDTRGYVITECNMEFAGICPQCQLENKNI